MSEFQLNEGQGFIYIGEYFHKYGKEVPNEKKVSKTDSILSIPQIDDYAFSLDFTAEDIYLVNDCDKIYKALIALLANDQLSEDWYEDTDNDLKNRVAKFMDAFGYTEITDIDGDGIPDHLDDVIG
jgi:hypothetical protein